MKKLYLVTLTLFISLTACKVGRYVVYNFADINDHKKFPYRTLAASKAPFKFHTITENKSLAFLTNKAGDKVSFDEHLEKIKPLHFWSFKTIRFYMKTTFLVTTRHQLSRLFQWQNPLLQS